MGWLEKNIPKNRWTEILLDCKRAETDSRGNFLVNVAYRRVSTDKQASDGYGLDVQRNEIIRYCKINELENCILLTDDGVTGTRIDRDGLDIFCNMVKDFNDGNSNIRINRFIVPRIDRLSRSLLNTLQFIQDYIVNKSDSKNSSINTNEYDIDFISINEPFCRVEKNNPSSKLMLTLFASLAEYDRDQIVAKMQKGRIERVRSGKPMGGGIPPYGYRYDRDKEKYVVVESERIKIIEAFRLFTEEKLSPKRIAELLNFKSEGVVINILKRRTSLGFLPYKGAEYLGMHEPIITENMYLAAAAEFENRSKKHGRSVYMLAGLLVCGNCGAKMHYKKWGKQVKICCYSGETGKEHLCHDPNCKNERYSAADIEAEVIKNIFELSYINDQKNTKRESCIEVYAALKKEIDKKEKELKRLYNIYAEESSQTLLSVISDREKEISDLKESIKNETEIKKKKTQAARNNSILKTIRSAWGNMLPEEKKGVCNELIDRVVITGTDAGPKLDIYFKIQQY